MATTVAVSGQPQKNDGGTILQAGNIGANSPVSTLTLATNASESQNGSKVIQSATSNIGTMKPISGGAFAKMTAGKYIVRGLTGQSIAGVALSGIGNIKISADQDGNYSIKRWGQYERLHITSWNYSTGVATYGGNSGDPVYLSAVDGTVVDSANKQTIDEAANPTKAIPGELVYMTTGLLPTQANYSAR